MITAEEARTRADQVGRHVSEIYDVLEGLIIERTEAGFYSTILEPKHLNGLEVGVEVVRKVASDLKRKGYRATPWLRDDKADWTKLEIKWDRQGPHESTPKQNPKRVSK